MNFEAPINSNEKVGNLVINSGDEKLMEIEILTNNKIARKKSKDYICECLDSIV